MGIRWRPWGLSLCSLFFLAGLVVGNRDTAIAQRLGSSDRPIRLVLPLQDNEDNKRTAQLLAEMLSTLTGYTFQGVIIASWDQVTAQMDQCTGDTMAIVPTDLYVRITDQNPNVHCRLNFVIGGYNYSFSAIYAPRDKISRVNDLQEKVWLIASTRSANGYGVPKAFFKSNGITVVEKVLGGRSEIGALVDVLQGQGDFCAGAFTPPKPPAGYRGPRWEFLYDDPEKWLWDKDRSSLVPAEERGTCNDLRAKLGNATEQFGKLWEIVEKIGIVTLIGPIPNDCIAFCRWFPEYEEDRIVTAIIQSWAIREGRDVWARFKDTGWENVMLVNDEFYDAYRALVGLYVPLRR